MPRSHRRLATALGVSVGVASFLLIAPVGVWLSFLAAIGIFYWVRDVRNVTGSGPKWLNLILGAIVWLGIGVGAYLLRGEADRFLSHLGISFYVGVFLVLALVFLGFSAWIYLGVPSDRVIARWEQMPWNLGVMCAFMPLGLAILLIFAALALPMGSTWGSAVLWIGLLLGLPALLFVFWQPDWIKPRWMRGRD